MGSAGILNTVLIFKIYSHTLHKGTPKNKLFHIKVVDC
ncbi:hypothetical protein GXM_05157 [Nostoc sphaeroides CCNUC1]|uniref:Uncharacterized protein n=1 Tax=Nostoc sphaeroides CCNUC1 TaxID=2653204 RepID=A0A5P8W4K4_9NOSO|nr:hypothetical protein GXM_05157 [Nostoc sphaeroides CCNUC1]